MRIHKSMIPKKEKLKTINHYHQQPILLVTTDNDYYATSLLREWVLEGKEFEYLSQ